MSSRCSFSLYQLCAIILERREHLVQLCENRFTPQKTRLIQHPDQTGVLTNEQQNLNKRVSVVSDDFEETLRLILAAELLFYDYEEAQPNIQPQLRDQITDLFDDIGVRIQHLECKVRELPMHSNSSCS